MLPIIPLNLSADEIRQRFGALLVNHLGGPKVVEMTIRHFEDRESVREIAATMQLSPTTVHRRISTAKAGLQTLGLWPEHWSA